MSKNGLSAQQAFEGVVSRNTLKKKATTKNNQNLAIVNYILDNYAYPSLQHVF